MLFEDRIIVSDGTINFDTRCHHIRANRIDSSNIEQSDVWNLNELECVGDKVYANQWMSPFIHVISAIDGELITTLDLPPAIRHLRYK